MLGDESFQEVAEVSIPGRPTPPSSVDGPIEASTINIEAEGLAYLDGLDLDPGGEARRPGHR